MLISLAMHAALAQVERIDRPGTDASAEHIVVIPCPLQPWAADDAIRGHRGTVTVVQLDRPVASREEVLSELGRIDVSDATVVAFGAGAALALQAGWQAEQWVFIAPVTQGVPTQATRNALTLDDGGTAQQLLLGGVVQGWSHTTRQLGIDAILLGNRTVHFPDADGTVLLSAGDELAMVEAMVPAAHDAGLTIERIGTGGWLGRDLSHTDITATRAGRRAIRRALRRQWRRR